MSGQASSSSSNPYFPSSTTDAEEFELTSPPARSPTVLPPPASPPSLTSSPRASKRTRGFSLQSITELSNHSTAVLFDSLQQRNRTVSSGGAGAGASPVLQRRPLSAAVRVGEGFTQADSEEERRGRRTSNILLGLGAEDHTWKTARGMKSAWRRRLFLVMEEPKSSEEALYIHWSTTFLILFSALLTIVSTLPGYHTIPALARALFGLDTTVVVLFTVEYIARLLAHSDNTHMLRVYVTSFFGVTDFLAVAPYYLELIAHADTSIMFRFSILRIFRLLRVFRAFRYSNTVILTIEVMRISIDLSKDALLALSFFILMVVIIFSTLVYFAERGSWDDTLQTFVDANGEPANFGSIPAAAWFVLVTITTVGYGDESPRTTLGRLVTVPLLIFGLLLIALPSFVLGKNFATVWDALQHADQTGFEEDHEDENGIPVSMLSAQPPPIRLSHDVEDERTHYTLGDDEDKGDGHESDASDTLDRKAAVERDLEAGRKIEKGKKSRQAAKRKGKAREGDSTEYRALLPGSAPRSPSENLPTSSAGGGEGRQQRQRSPKKPQMGPFGDDGGGERSRAGDLTNLKLARNQEALSTQIDALREVVESQGRLLERLLVGLERPRHDQQVRRRRSESRDAGDRDCGRKGDLDEGLSEREGTELPS